MHIRPACETDAAAIAEIYNYYIEETTITFEMEPVSAETMRERIASISRDYKWIVAEDETSGKLLGYAYAGILKARSAYRHSVETSIYLDKNCRSKGLGSTLYQELIEQLKAMSIHTVIAIITCPNEESEGFHRKHGFTKAGHLKETGFKFGRFIDVAYYQLMI
ncbi:MAG: N-acetyltransferase [Opitutales bacterium]|nr:N-acetyltransferase [Opitutales bacterium]